MNPRQICPKCNSEGSKLEDPFYTRSCDSILCEVDKFNAFGKWSGIGNRD
jgi:hypothetical protein